MPSWLASAGTATARYASIYENDLWRSLDDGCTDHIRDGPRRPLDRRRDRRRERDAALWRHRPARPVTTMGVDQEPIIHPPATGEPPDRVGERLPAGLVRLSDPEVKPTPIEGPPVVAPLIAHEGQATLFHAREKVGKSTFLSAAVAAVTQGRAFLGVPLAAGDVLWVGEEAAADVKGRLTRDGADLDRVLFIRSPSPDQQEEGSLPQLVARFRPRWLVIDTWTHYLTSVQRTGGSAGPVEQARRLGEVVDLSREYGTAATISHHNQKHAPRGGALGAYLGSAAIGAAVDMLVSLTPGRTARTRRLTPYGRWQQQAVTIKWSPDRGYRVLGAPQATRLPSPDRALPLKDRLSLLLLQVGSDARPPARVLAAALGSGGSRYQEFKEVLDELVASELIDHRRRPATTARHMGGYALTPAGRARAESVRETGASRTPSSGD